MVTPVLKLVSTVPNGVHPGQGVHARPNPVAREQAYVRVLELLRAAFDGVGILLRPQ